MARLLLPTLLIAFAVTCTICSAQDADAPAVSPAAKKAAERINRLGLSLLKGIHEAKKGNLALSPWPTFRSLALVHLGAAGNTRKELSDFLQSDDPISDQQQLLATIDPQIAHWNGLTRQERQPGERLDQIAWASLSGVWTRADVPIHEAFRTAAGRMHGTVIRGIDFKNPGKALVDINTWIANATEQRIPRVLAPGSFSENTGLCITSITFFKAPWLLFKPRDTRHEPFVLDGANSVRVPTMITKSGIGSEVHDSFTALTLAIANHNFHLLLLVPKEGTTVASLIEKLNSELLQNCANLQKTPIELHLPRFKVAPSTLQLRDFLIGAGVKSAFDVNGKADFSALAARPIYLDQVHDAAQFEVDENGVSGAGASVIVPMVFGGGPLPTNSVFRVNRSFLFALQHKDTGACLFLGRVTDPRPSE